MHCWGQPRSRPSATYQRHQRKASFLWRFLSLPWGLVYPAKEEKEKKREGALWGRCQHGHAASGALSAGAPTRTSRGRQAGPSAPPRPAVPPLASNGIPIRKKGDDVNTRTGSGVGRGRGEAGSVQHDDGGNTGTRHLGAPRPVYRALPCVAVLYAAARIVAAPRCAG